LQKLLANGADPFQRNSKDKIAYEYALEKGNTIAATLLKQSMEEWEARRAMQAEQLLGVPAQSSGVSPSRRHRRRHRKKVRIVTECSSHLTVSQRHDVTSDETSETRKDREDIVSSPTSPNSLTNEEYLTFDDETGMLVDAPVMQSPDHTRMSLYSCISVMTDLKQRRMNVHMKGS